MNRPISSLKPHLLLRLRNRHFMLLDAVMLCVAPALALMLRVDGFQLWAGTQRRCCSTLPWP